MKKFKIVCPYNSEYVTDILEENGKYIIKSGTRMYIPSTDCKTRIPVTSEMDELHNQRKAKNLRFTQDVEFYSLEKALNSLIADSNNMKYIYEIKEYPESEETPIEEPVEHIIEKTPIIQSQPMEEAVEVEMKETENIEETKDLSEYSLEELQLELHNRKLEAEYKAHKERLEEQRKLLEELKESTQTNTIELGENSLNKISELLESNETLHNDLVNLAESIKSEKSDCEEIKEEEFDWGEEAPSIEGTPIIGYPNLDTKIEHALAKPRKAVLLEGVPGTGKTLAMYRYADTFETCNNVLRMSLHQGITYTDLMGGWVADGKNGFVWRDGVVVKVCKRAAHDRLHDYLICLDEISRANILAALGEIITAMTMRDRKITLACGKQFMIPNNVYFIFTRNVTDHSAIDLDYALLQRMERITLKPQWTTEYVDYLKITDGIVKNALGTIAEIMKALNEEIEKDNDLGENYLVGTRSITIENISAEQLKENVENELIKSIKDLTANSIKIQNTVEKVIKLIRDTISELNK